MIGSSLAHYRITAKLGEGGMGEVYRATDTKLDREVAIKVLPAAFTEDKERLARFEREAKLLAQLHHPNIASIFGLEESDGTRALVMELVEGPTLAERLESGALPFNESLSVSLQIAHALEEAHEKGIVHRDLKPQNIKASREGKVKVLDFGLAKAMDPLSATSGEPGTASALAASPTLTLGATQMGVILGTAAYMSPEQAKGLPVDKRADIWSFGVVLWEMLTGLRMFEGDSVTETLAGVLKNPVDLDALPAETPGAIRRLLRRCLERNPKDRLRDIGEARLALAEAIVAPAEERASAPTIAGGVENRWARALPWAVVVAALAVAAWALARTPRADGSARAAGTASATTHVELSLPSGVDLVTRVPAGLAVSPDGRAIAMIGFREAQRLLYVRPLDRVEAVEIKASSGVNALTFSPDGESVVFVPGGSRVIRVSLADQQSATLADCADLRNSLAWGERGIYYLCRGEIWRVPAAGGEPVRLTQLDAARNESLHTDQVELPGARTLLFANLTDDTATSRIEALSLDDGARRVVVENATTPAYSPTGHLLFERDGALWAMRFDVGSAAVSGHATQVLAATALAAPLYGSLPYRLSPSGTLAYMPREFDEKRVLVVARDGSERPLDLPPAAYATPRVSRDGRRLLLERSQSVEAFDFERGTRTQIVRGSFGTSFPHWSGDDQRVLLRRATLPIWVASDGSGRGGSVPGGSINDYPASPGPDPDTVLTVRIAPETAGDILLVSISGAAPERILLASPAYEGAPQLSPDGHWLLYQSNESGQPEIYVRDYPALARAWQVSEGGGAQPRWSRDGREIYSRGGGKIVAASFDGRGSEPRLGRPTALFADEYDFGPGITSPNYDVTADGRFVFFRRTPLSGRIHVVLDWLPELERRIAAGGAR
jgi:eukaryotic-like serine/threonine-protein kinase